MGRLNTTVHVADETGTYQVFGPGDELPEWAEKAITNPKVWAEEPEQETAPAPKRTRAKKV